MTTWITIDGSQGEGGGQVLRTSLALSLVTGRPFRIEQIRAGRKTPGLLRQHLTAVQAARDVGAASVTGAEIGSRTVSFAPARIDGGEHHFVVGTAGSATLVLQAVLPALLRASGPSRLTLEGGTHNPYAPPFDFLVRTLLPLLRKMGAAIGARLDAYGFYPAGGGRVVVDVEPCPRLAPLTLLERGDVRVRARALSVSVPAAVARRELAIVQARLGIAPTACVTEQLRAAAGPGNALMISLESDAVTEMVTGFGMKGVTAETVAARTCDDAMTYLAGDVPVGMHLADQLLVFLALAGGGSFRTLPPTAHTTTNIAVIRQFLDVPIAIACESDRACRIVVGTTV